MTFKNLIADKKILKALEKAHYSIPTPIQEKAIPLIQQGFDLRASAQTGTGKTAAFLLPTLERLLTPSPAKGIGPRVLILLPTRELAMQVATEAEKYSEFLSRTKTVCIFGGAPYPPQNRALAKPHEILVATPGRLMDHMQEGRVDLSRVELFILDEADRMLDMGFIDAVTTIADALPEKRQTLLFSATMQGAVLKLSNRLLNEPQEISISALHTKHENISQLLHFVDDIEHKQRLLEHLLESEDLNQAVIFTSTKLQADRLAKHLSEGPIRTATLHGGMRQPQRIRTIAQLRKGAIRVLVATDVAARGIDVAGISHVINFDLPHNPEDYVHRIGRTGRAGSKGSAISLVSSRDRENMQAIEKFLQQRIEVIALPGFEPTKNFAEPVKKTSKQKKPFPSKKRAFFSKTARKKKPFFKKTNA